MPRPRRLFILDATGAVCVKAGGAKGKVSFGLSEAARSRANIGHRGKLSLRGRTSAPLQFN